MASIQRNLDKRDFPQAQRECLQLLADCPHSVDGWNLFAAVLYTQGDPAAAADALRQSLTLEPRQPETLNNLGAILTECGEHLTALELMQSAIQLFPNFAPVYNSVGNSHRELGQYGFAAEAYRKALQLDPDLTAAHNNLGAVLIDFGLEEAEAEAEAHLLTAIQQDQDRGSAYLNLSSLYNRQKKFELAEQSAREAKDRLGATAEVLTNLGVALQGQGEQRLSLECLRKAADLDDRLAHNYLFALGHDSDATDDEISAAHRRWGERVESQAQQRLNDSGRLNDSDRGAERKHSSDADSRPLRVGYVSGDFRMHVAARYVLPLLLHHDRERFKVFAYSESPEVDAITALMESRCEGWRITVGASDKAVADQVQADEVDILVDLAGHTKGNRLGVFALRPAPVQVTWLGYPHTTGLSSIDYVLTNRLLNPESTQGQYTEKLFWIDGPTACWLPPKDSPEVNSLPALQNNRITFGSLHRPNKLTPATLELWASVLTAAKDSQLRVFFPTLIGPVRERVQQFFDEHGLERRVKLLHEAGEGGYLAEYHQVDIALDVTPWTGGTTTRDACWMGAAPIALCGERRSSRGSADVLHWLGMDDCVARDVDEYVRVAVELSSDPERLATLRSQLREKTQQSLCRHDIITQRIEASFEAMWRERLSEEGLPGGRTS